MNNNGTIYSANLNRKFLRENEDLIIRKYSRKTEIDFTLFGIVTQHKRKKTESKEPPKEFSNLKEAMMNLVSSLCHVESTFSGRLDNEVIIDPIALYTEL